MMCLGLLLAFAGGASAFSLLGPFKADGTVPGLNWQTRGYGGRPAGLGYNLGGDIGGPMLPTEAYRWNVPTLTYAFDSTFLNYFGPEGVTAVEEAIAILNALPPASQMSATLSEFALDTKGQNGTAAASGLLDIKSYALAVMLEQMGLAAPERFVWNLRTRVAGNLATNYTVIQLNYDPVTISPTRYVNGVLYNYVILDAIGPQGGEWASAVEWYQLDPLFIPYSSVAGAFANDVQLADQPSTLFQFSLNLTAGQFYSALTRDDVGGLRYLLSTNHLAFDTLLPTVLPRVAGSDASPWVGIISTNNAGTNAVGTNVIVINPTNFPGFVTTAYRPGVDKISFQRVPLLGTNFTPITLNYTDRYINATNGRVVKQPVQRLVLQPDIIFSVKDLGTTANDSAPFIFSRNTTANWTNNAALNTFVSPVGLGGPGTIYPPVVISFSDMVPYFFNFAEGETDAEGFTFGIWGSFDGSTRPPVAFPIYQGLTLEYLQDVVLQRTGN